MKSKIKNNFFKIVSLICALAIVTLCLVSGISVSASTVAFSDLVSEIVALTPAQYVVDFANVIYDVYLFFFEDSVMSDRETSRLKIQAAWKVFTDNSCFTSDEFSEYWDACINELGLADDRLIMIEETIRLGFTKEEIIAYCYESDGQGISVSDQGDVNVSSSVIKDIYSDYASRYMPMPTVDTYRWSYQDCKGKKSTTPDYYGFFDFYPLAPIYTYTQGQWGDKGWSSVYMLCYLYDDDVGYYYSKQYVHIYPSSSDDGSPLFNLDYHKLSDNTLTYSYTVPWRTDRLYYALSNESEVSAYSNAMDYLGNSSPLYLYSLSDSSPYRDFVQLYTGSVNSISQYVYSSSFDPVNNTADDCGFILSSKPFELVLNQTSIDFDRVPDNYVITIEGDTIYNYPITNPDTGDSSTINYYITNNYTLPESSAGDSSGDDDSSSSGSTSGNVNVSGEVVVGGQIDIKSDPIDINVNVNTGSSSDSTSSEGVQFDQDVSLNNYYDWMNDQTSVFSGFMKQFFNWLPPDILIMICAGFGLVILARFLGR